MHFSTKVLITNFMFALVMTQAGLVTGAEDDDYVIDTLIVVDDVMYDSWKSFLSPDVTDATEISEKIREYVSLVVHQANKRLATIRRHVSIGMRMQVSETRVNEAVLAFVPESLLTRRIRAERALERFHTWVVDNGLHSGQEFDHFMLLTGRPMESVYEGVGRSSVSGRAHIGTVCDLTGRSVSVVQDLGGFQSVHVVAHELAHSLGAYHDGESGAEDCRDADRFLMSAFTQAGADDESDVIQRNPWYLSTCSTEDISTRIAEVAQSQDNCLATTSPPAPEFTSARALVAGQVYDAPAQCRMLYGQGSALCLGTSFSHPDGICTQMFCSKTDSSCAQHYAAEGTSCGNKKWCSMGQCIESEDAPEVDAACPYGDTALVRGDGSTCADYIARFPSACYSEETREICCQSCAAIHTGRDVCPYGDKRLGCTPDMCQQINPQGTLLAELCCGTCDFTTAPECRDQAIVDELTCPERVAANTRQECYNWTVAFHCCESCSRQRRNITGCEYGDSLRGTYCQSRAGFDYSGCDRRLTSVCCLTCDPESREQGDGDPGSASHLLWSLVSVVFPLLILLDL